MTGGRSLKGLVRLLGPGLLTGAADDDPSGIATYSQSGAQFGYALCWTMFLTTPFMVAVQIVSARIGAVTGRGLAANLGKVLPPVLLYGIVALTVVANTVNIAADIAAMGEAVRLLVGGPAVVYALTLGDLRRRADRHPLPPVRAVHEGFDAGAVRLCRGGVQPSRAVGRGARVHVHPATFLAARFRRQVVAVLGTTISPYLFFWQASLEVEERRVIERKKEAPLQNGNALARRRFEPIVIDTWTGMALSNIVGFFIIVTTAATLHAHGIDKIGTAADAAEALRPSAGRAAFLLFSLGIVGTGLLAIPALAGSAAYAIAETFGWKGSLGLRPQRAPAFYLIIGGATLVGSLGAMTRSIRSRCWSGARCSTASWPPRSWSA